MSGGCAPRTCCWKPWLAMQNPSFRWMMLGFIVIIVAFGVATATGLHMYTFFWGLNRFQILIALVAGPVGSMLGYAVARPFFAWLDKRDAMIVGGFCWMILYALPVLLYLAGWSPPPGSLGVGELPDPHHHLRRRHHRPIARRHRHRHGRHRRRKRVADRAAPRRGVLRRIGLRGQMLGALGSFFAGLVLTLIDWPTGSAVRTAADIPPDTLLLLAVLTGPVTALLALPGLALLRGYRLNRSKLEGIQAALKGAAG